MSFANWGGVAKCPLTVSPYVDDFGYFAAPTPPGGEEMETEDDQIMLTETGEIMVTE
jgi:hypothetical protein